MKRLIRPFLILVLSLALSAGFSEISADSFSILKGTAAQAAETKVTTDYLNLRTGAGTGYRIILTMPKGATVIVTSSSGEWSKVSYNGTTGYANNKYLTSAISTGTVYSIISRVNLRSGPSTGYSILTKVPRDAMVTVHSISGSWARLTYSGRTGYSHTSYLTKGKEYYTTGSLNLRSGRGTGNSIITLLPSGAKVQVFNIQNNWGRVYYKGMAGYSSMSYLTTQVSTPTPSDPPPSGTTAKKIYKGINSIGKAMAITFDDGASTANMNRVLDILDQYNAKSTFFLTGEWILANPAMARKIVDRGHKLESHTVSHPYLTSLSDSQVLYQLNRSREIIKNTVGTTTTLLRPPYGDTSDRVQRLVGQAGYRYMVMWSIDTDDYKSATTSSDVVRRAVAGASTNGILLLHPSHNKVVEALPRILSQLRDQGYIFTTVNAMVP